MSAEADPAADHHLVQAVRKDLSKTLDDIRLHLTSLAKPTPPHAPSPDLSCAPTLQPLTPGLPAAFVHLLTIFRQTVTSLSLSIKPPLSHSAVIATLAKLSKEFQQIVTCVVAAPKRGAVEWEWRDGVNSLGEEIMRLLEVVTKEIGDGVGEGYLTHTGMVWDALNRIGTPSQKEVNAVIKRWEGQRAVVKDAWAEFTDLLQDGGENDLGFQDGEADEIFGGMSLTPEEKARAETAKPLLALHQILHSSIPRFIPQLALEPEHTYLLLLEAGSAFVDTFDAAVSSFHTSQDEEDIDVAMEELIANSERLIKQVRRRLQEAGEVERTAQCRKFLERWVQRSVSERIQWTKRHLSMNGLAQALQ